jgi:ribokinase
MTLSLPRIVVVGSVNMDLVARVPRLPRGGETLEAVDFFKIPGGKGANQAVAVSRLGGNSAIIARVGDDAYGQQLIDALVSAGVDTSAVELTRSCSSGLALISVDDRGENSIVLVGGANARLSPHDILQQEDLIAPADALLIQLEIPIESVATAVELARRHHVKTILDPAPAPANGLPSSLYQVDVLTPNEVEAGQLTGRLVDSLDDAADAALDLRARGASCVIVTLGELGAMVCAGHTCTHVPSPAVASVDTTAAGDAFAAALTVQLASGELLANAARFACLAGALATTKLGAQQAMPTRAEIEELLANEVVVPTSAS